MQPAANGAGIPPIKAYLNGTKVSKVFNFKTFLTKFFASIGSIAPTLPQGQEGNPIVIFYRSLFFARNIYGSFKKQYMRGGYGVTASLIHMGGMIGGGISQARNKTLGTELKVNKNFQNDRDRRDFIAMGMRRCSV